MPRSQTRNKSTSLSSKQRAPYTTRKSARKVQNAAQGFENVTPSTTCFRRSRWPRRSITMSILAHATPTSSRVRSCGPIGAKDTNSEPTHPLLFALFLCTSAWVHITLLPPRSRCKAPACGGGQKKNAHAVRLPVLLPLPPCSVFNALVAARRSTVRKRLRRPSTTSGPTGRRIGT